MRVHENGKMGLKKDWKRELGDQLLQLHEELEEVAEEEEEELELEEEEDKESLEEHTYDWIAWTSFWRICASCHQRFSSCLLL